jgi:small subunit ribosomal protein S18
MAAKVCAFCDNHMDYIDYKNVPMLIRNCMSYYAKIKPRRYTGTCLRHQKKASRAIKRARIMGLMLFVK